MAKVINKKNVEYLVLWLGKTISGYPVSRQSQVFKSAKEATDQFYHLVDRYDLVVWREDSLNNLIYDFMADGEIDGETSVIEIKTLVMM
jgi:hypothetical protein